MSRLVVKAAPHADRAVLDRGSPSRHLNGATGPAILAVASFLLIWPFARLDLDRHHDGYMLAQALAVHQGASVHTDVFAQYGPVTPWLQSLALFLPIGPGLALRTINVVFIAVTVFFLADMGRRTPRGWPVSHAVGWWAAIAWIALADLWLGIPMLPWSSTLAAMLSIGTLYLFTRSMRCAEDGSARAGTISASAGGICLGLLPFTRINVGLSACAVCIVVAVLVLITEPGAKRRSALFFVLGAFLSSLSVVVALVGTGSLGDFFFQAVTWPLTWGRKAADTWQTQTFLTAVFASQALPVSAVCATLAIQSRARTVQHRWNVTGSGARVLTVLVGLIVVSWETLRGLADAKGATSGKAGAPDLFLQLTSSNVEYRYFFMVLAAEASVLVCGIQAFRYFSRRRSIGELTPWLLLGGLALSGLTQIVPTWDPRHVWWAAPVGLLLLFSVVRATSRLDGLTSNPLTLPLAAVVLLSILSASAYWSTERVAGKPGTLIEGMLVSRQTSNQISQDAEFLRGQLGRAGSVVYLVDDGDLSVLDGKYRSADAYFVDWGGSPRVSGRIDNGNPIVIQTSSFGQGSITDFARSIQYGVVARNQRLVVLKPLDGTSG